MLSEWHPALWMRSCVNTVGHTTTSLLFRERFAVFLRTEPYRIQIEGDNNGIEYIFRVEGVQPVPYEFR